MLDQDSGREGCDPLAFGSLDADNIFVIYGRGCRGSGM